VQRAEARKGQLDTRRVHKLLSVGVTWGKNFDERWEERFLLLKAFKKKHGHCHVLLSESIELKGWIQNQRNFQQNGTLLPARKARLDAIGFAWRDEKRPAEHSRYDSCDLEDSEDEESLLRVKEGGSEMDEAEDVEIQEIGSETDEVEMIEIPTKTIETKRKVSCALGHVEGKQRKVESRNNTDRVKERRPARDRGNASRVKDGDNEMDEAELIELPTKSLETKRKASCAPKRSRDKRRKSGTLEEEESRAEKDQGNASLVKDGSAQAESSNTTDRASAPTFPVGTRFRKEFPGHGTFQGTIMSFDGEHHRVYYLSDGDSEELSDYELDDVEIIEIPTGRAKASNKNVNR
jgi:hypothetical protein